MAIFTFRACGVNPTLQLTREQYTRNMAVWYIRTMAASGVALLLFLLGYYPSHSPAPAVVETPVAAPWQLGWASEPASQRVRRSRQTNTQKKQTTLFTICAERLRKSRVEMEPRGKETAVGWNTKARKRMLPQGESDPFDAMPPVAWSKFPRLIGRAGRNKKAATEGTCTHGALHRYQCCCLIIPAAAVSSIQLAHEVSEWASDHECCGVVAARESSVACWFAALLWLAAMAAGAAAANNNNNNNVDASNKAELPSLQDLNNETVDLVITSFHCFFFHVAAMSKMVTSCLVSFQPRLILARS